MDGQLLLAAFEHADDPAFRVPHLSAPVLRGRLQGHFHAVAMPRVAKKAGMDKISGCNRDCTRLRLSPSTGFGASSGESCTASGVTNPAPERWMDSTPVTIRLATPPPICRREAG
ncbi:MAG: hypothetical protein ACLSAH_16590 [Bilophila wadsworthia]